MNHGELCDVTRYASAHYSKEVPLPTSKINALDNIAAQDEELFAQLSVLKAAMLDPQRHHQHHQSSRLNYGNKSGSNDSFNGPLVTEETAAAVTAMHEHLRAIDDAAAAAANAYAHCPDSKSNGRDHDNKKEDKQDTRKQEARAAAVFEAAKATLYAAVEVNTDVVHRPATNQKLVREFLLDGSTYLNGETLSGYPIYGHRTAEERLAALREALYDGKSWKAMRRCPTRTIVTADPSLSNNSANNGDGVENEVVLEETREQYWRRLARHFIHAHQQDPTAGGSLPTGEAEDAFFIIDVGRVIEQMALWRHCLPMVRPHFAVKCNPNLAIIEVLAACGAGFDCASRAEIDLIMKGGKRGPGSLVGSPDDIIFANPCKQPGDLKAAAAAGVNYVTFDNTLELEKIARYMPNAKAVLRIRTNDAKAACPFSVKFGAPLELVDELLDTACALNVEIYGVSFHVGSGNGDASAYTDAVRDAHFVFQRAALKGFNCTLLDIGGGYPGVTPTPEEQAAGKLSFEHIADALRPVLVELFPDDDVTIIAEPGRYFTTATHALALQVFAARRLQLSPVERAACRAQLAHMAAEKHRLQKKAKVMEDDRDNSNTDDDENDEVAPLVDMDTAEEHQYYVNDGLYGSFNSIIFDHAAPTLLLLNDGDGAEFSVHTESHHNRQDDETANTIVDSTPAAAPAVPATATVVVSCAYGSITSRASSPASSPTGAFEPTRHTDPNNHNRNSNSTDTTAEDAVSACIDQDAIARRRTQSLRPLCVTTLYGPTCDSMDCILKQKPFPRMEIGDWLLVPDMGSYTTAAGCAFNGFETRRFEWVCSVDV